MNAAIGTGIGIGTAKLRDVRFRTDWTALTTEVVTTMCKSFPASVFQASARQATCLHDVHFWTESFFIGRFGLGVVDVQFFTSLPHTLALSRKGRGNRFASCNSLQSGFFFITFRRLWRQIHCKLWGF